MWNRDSKTVTFFSVLYLLIIRSYPVWYRIEGGAFTLSYYFITFLLFMILVIQFFNQFVRLIKGWQKSLKSSWLSILIISVALSDGIFNPLSIDLEYFYGDIVFRACREGTQNQATMRFRENGHFDIHWTGVFFADSYYSGVYRKNGDTLLLEFDGIVPGKMNDTLIIEDSIIYRMHSDSLISTHFYLGYCKGLN